MRGRVMPRPVRGRRRPTGTARPSTSARATGTSVAVATADAEAHLPDLLNLSAEDDALARFETISQETEGGAPALIAALGDSRDAAAGLVLTAIATSAPDKELRKTARRALHRLRSAGLDVTVPIAADVESHAPIADTTGQVTRALVSPVDGAGSRLLWLIVERRYGSLTMF